MTILSSRNLDSITIDLNTIRNYKLKNKIWKLNKFFFLNNIQMEFPKDLFMTTLHFSSRNLDTIIIDLYKYHYKL